MYNLNAKLSGNLDREDGFLTAVINGTLYQIDRSATTWFVALDCFKSEDWKGFIDAHNVFQAVKKWSNMGIHEENGELYYGSHKISDVMQKRIREHMRHGISYEYLELFLKNLFSNPSPTAIKELYSFMEHKNLPITASGNLLAYKNVRSDFKDWHTGKFDNSVGSVVEEPRHIVDTNQNRHCSRGLHLGSLEFAKNFQSGGHVLICEVNPADVVCIPNDHNCQKMRCCKYKVVSIYGQELSDPVYNINNTKLNSLLPARDISTGRRRDPVSGRFLKG